MSISTASVTTASIQRWKKTAVGGETTLSGADDNGTILAYTPGYEEVYKNGALLVRGTDYVATTGSSITGLSALSAGNVIQIIAFSAFVFQSATADDTMMLLMGAY